jgi:hypothetical protein
VKNFRRLDYLAGCFGMVEINTSTTRARPGLVFQVFEFTRRGLPFPRKSQVMRMDEAAELAHKKAELEKLCDEYLQQANKLLETFSEITNEIFALKKYGVAGIRVGIELMPRIRQIQNQLLLAVDAGTSEKPAN